jgi:restriction system protein
LEKTVIRLLGAMGYGADPEALVVTGASGDGGIDGIVRLDRLGLEHIYVQAKRHDASNKVQRKDIQAFLGALTERNATKGVFITTSDFASGARDFADRREGIVLINGEKLAELMRSSKKLERAWRCARLATRTHDRCAGDEARA